MKGILIAGVFAAFAITVIDSLKCRQCSSPFGSTESCPSDPEECTNTDSEAVSCVESLVNSTLGGSQSLYQKRSCSASNCEAITQADFTVRVSDAQQYHFVSQCCEDACKDTDSGPRNLANTQCSSCYSINGTCNETTQQCFEGEQCVHIIVQHGSDNNLVTEELKGCSDISDATCKTLDSENVKIGEFTFQKVNCTNAAIIPDTTTTTPTTVTTTPSTSTSLKASFISSVFGSLLLLKLLF